MKVPVPEIAENVSEAEVLELFVSVGDRVEADQAVAELEADKASFEMPCPAAGEVEAIHVEVGDEVSVGDVVLTLVDEDDDADDQDEDEDSDADAEEEAEEDAAEENADDAEEDADDAEEDADDAEEDADAEEDDDDAAEDDDGADDDESSAVSQAGTRSSGAGGPTRSYRASPAVRRRASERGIDLDALAEEFGGGRISLEQLDAHSRATDEPDPGEGFERFGEVEVVKLGRRRRLIAERMAEAWRTIPHVTQHARVDIAGLEAARERLAADGPAPGLTAIVAKAAALALHDHPRLNASLAEDGRRIVLKRYVHVGVAVDTEAGLIVPVVRDADRRPLRELDEELRELIEAAQDGKLSRAQLDGASFTITNLGTLGGTHFTPIINPPQVAILGLGRSIDEGQRRLLPLSLSYDHRVVDGADAMRFINSFAALLREPLALLWRA